MSWGTSRRIRTHLPTDLHRSPPGEQRDRHFGGRSIGRVVNGTNIFDQSVNSQVIEYSMLLRRLLGVTYQLERTAGDKSVLSRGAMANWRETARRSPVGTYDAS
jgi:hypothetical protein